MPTETELNTLLKNQVDEIKARIHDAEVGSQKPTGHLDGDGEPSSGHVAPPSDTTIYHRDYEEHLHYGPPPPQTKDGPPIQVAGTSKNDTFHSAGHDEAFTGGGGRDTFVFDDRHMGNDTIKDFGAGGHEVVWFDGVFDNFYELSSHTTRDGDNLVITLDEHNSVTLEHYYTGHHHLDPFDFVLT